MTAVQVTPVTQIHIALFITYIFATICLTLRIITRFLNRHGFWFDDYFALAAWIFATAWNALILLWVTHGLGQHITDVDEPKESTLYYARLLNWNLDLFYAFSLGSSKLSLLCLYWRLFSITPLRNPIRFLGVCAIIWIVVRTVLTLVMCVPVQGVWDKSVKATCNIDPRNFFFGSTFPHLFIDIAILCLPIWQISKLQMLGRVAKIGLCMTFAFGIFVCVASIIVLAPAFHFNGADEDVTWNNVSMFIWATVEVNLAIVAGSFPLLRGVAVYLCKGNRLAMDLDQEVSSYPLKTPDSTGSNRDHYGASVLNVTVDRPDIPDSLVNLTVLERETSSKDG